MSRLHGWRDVIIGLALVFGTLVSQSPAAVAPTHRLIIYPAPGETIAQLNQQGITPVVDYGSYWIVEVTDKQMAGLRKTHDNLREADYLDLVQLRSITLNTKAPEPAIPADLRQPESVTGNRLRLVQFKGPILPAWVKNLNTIPGLKVLSYIPYDAYVVWTDAKGEEELRRQQEPAGPIQWVGAYHPYYKLPTTLREASEVVAVDIAVVDAPEGNAVLAKMVDPKGIAPIVRTVTSGQKVFRITAEASTLRSIAQLPAVVWIANLEPSRLMDERQDLIIADQISPNAPHGPLTGAHYLDFLTNSVGGGLLSFQSASTYPIVDVADTGILYDNSNLGVTGIGTNVPTLVAICSPFNAFGQAGAGAESRVAYHNSIGFQFVSTLTLSNFCGLDFYFFDTAFNFFVSPTAGIDVNGHGTAIASLVAGFDTNAVSLDQGGFFQGIGISPYGLVGSTKIFWGSEINYEFLGFEFDTNFDVTASVFGVIPVTCDRPNFCLNDITGLMQSEYLSGARIANYSWGDLLPQSGGNRGVYSSECLAIDHGVRDALSRGDNPLTPGPSPLNQEMIVVVANGSGGSVGNVGGFADMTITPPATAKNVISVGATKNVRLDGSGCMLTGDQNESEDLATSDSFGPTVDGRFKPEIVAPGSSVFALGSVFPSTFTNVFANSATNGVLFDPFFDDGFFGDEFGFFQFNCQQNGQYTCEPGLNNDNCNELNIVATTTIDNGASSYAAPAVSGAIQLLWWYFQNRLNILPPTPAMAKAYVCNSARYLPILDKLTGAMDTLPSIGQGMGILDLGRMFDGVPRVLRDESTPRAIDLPLLTTNPAVQQTFFSQSGQSYRVHGQIYDATKPFRVTLAWTDADSSPAAFKQLVNDLDLQVTVNGTLYKGNVFSQGQSIPGGGFDDVNNMESVFLPAGQTGSWSVVVFASNIAGNGVPNVSPTVGTNAVAIGQDFALVVYNAAPLPAPSDVATLNTNDSCQTALEIGTFPFAFTNTLSPAVYHEVIPSPSIGPGGIQEFFTITVPTAGIAFEADTFGSRFDTLLTVWQANTIPQTVFIRSDCGALAELTSNNDATNIGPNRLQSQVQWTSDGSNTYYIVVEPYNGNIPAGGAQMVLNVNAVLPPISLLPAGTLDFGHELVGATNAGVTVQFTNGTVNAISVESLSIVGNNSDDFIILQNQCMGTLAASNACPLIVTFAPLASGIRTGQLVVAYGANGSPQVLTLIGIGDPPAPVVCAPSSLQFPAEDIGASATLTMVITNCGTLPMNNFSDSISGAAAADYTVLSTSCSPGPIAEGGQCTVTVQFAPTTNNERIATLNLVGGTTTQAVLLIGAGQLPTPAVCLSIGNGLDFGSVSLGVTNTQSIVITNCGTAVLAVGAISVSGPNANQFILIPAADGCLNSSLPPGGHCAFDVDFIPTSNGRASATVTINDNTAAGQEQIGLAGSGSNIQPDAQISKTADAKKYIGQGVYTPPSPLTSQELALNGAPGKTSVCYIRCQNAGSAPDAFYVTDVNATGGNGMQGVYKVQYSLGTSANTNDLVDITAAVNTAVPNGYATSSLDAGAIQNDATLIEMRITPVKGAAKGTYTIPVKFTSIANPAKSDTVAVVLKIR